MDEQQGANMSTAGTERLHRARRVVIKVGSALLVDETTGRIHETWLESLAADIARMRARGQEVAVVSSGAIAVGRRLLGLIDRPLRLEEKQAAAATGQLRLAHAYQNALARHDLQVAQILVTIADSESRRRYLNARNTVETLLKLGVIPVINENDTVATAEIRFGDNDRLSARVAQMISADLLVLLSDIDGLYTADPATDPDARLIPEVRELDQTIMAMAGGSASAVGTGGMITKLQAARIAVDAGSSMVIGLGRRPSPVAALEDGAPCTWFLSDATPRTARKRWIAGSLKSKGVLTIDDGALAALKTGKSLLPAGVKAVEGGFQRGDAVMVRTLDGREVARGLSAYAADEAQRIAGRRSGDIDEILGFRGRDEIIHRDDLVLFEQTV